MSDARICGNCSNFPCGTVKPTDTPDELCCRDFNKARTGDKVCMNCMRLYNCGTLPSLEEMRTATCERFEWRPVDDVRPPKHATTPAEKEAAEMICVGAACGPRKLEPYFSAYMSMMTDCNLFKKSDIARVLARMHSIINSQEARNGSCW